MLGLDPVYMGNEGKMIAIVSKKDAEKAVSLIRNSKYGENACIIGEVKASIDSKVILHTEIGGERIIGPLYGEGLPRIC
jgi:hydrogenase expression/formation protein HypE